MDGSRRDGHRAPFPSDARSGPPDRRPHLRHLRRGRGERSRVRRHARDHGRHGARAALRPRTLRGREDASPPRDVPRARRCRPRGPLRRRGAAPHRARQRVRIGRRRRLLERPDDVRGAPPRRRPLDRLAGWGAAGRLVILTCDREPTFVTRLRDRFADSALTAIAPPEPALRLAILRDKARRHGIELDAHLARRLANDFGGNVRRLEGALTRLVAHARLCGARVDEALAVAVFPELAAPAPAPLTVDDVIVATARAFGTSVRRLRGRDRRHAVRLPRQVAMHLGRKIVGSSYGALGEAFGRDHTTVLQACRSVATRLETDRSLAATVARIEQRLATGTR